MSKVEDDGVIYDHKHSSLCFNCLRCFTCTRMTNTRIEKQRLIQETTKCHWCCPKTQVTQIDQDQIDDIQLRRHMILWCCCGKCKFLLFFSDERFFLSNSPRTHLHQTNNSGFDPGVIRMWGKDEDEGIDPSYVDLGLFANSERVFEAWSDVLCQGNDNSLKAMHGAGV